MRQTVARSMDVAVRLSVGACLLTAWTWPVWRLIWTRDLAPGLVALPAIVWLIPGCIVLTLVVGAGRPRKWIYALTPLAALVGVFAGAPVLIVLDRTGLWEPAIIVWLACLLAWPVVRLVQRRPGAWRLVTLALVAVCVAAAVVGLTSRDESKARTAGARAAAAGKTVEARLQYRRVTGVSTDWPLMVGSAAGASGLVIIGAWASRRKARGARTRAAAPRVE